MRILWTLFKVVVGLAIAIPLCIVALSVWLGILGAIVGLAILALKLGVVALIGYGVFKVATHLFRPAPQSRGAASTVLPRVDPHYEAAMRELDRELGETPHR